MTGRREFVVHEGGLKFLVNLSDYVDTGLFLDHRITRQMVREAAAGKRFLNLFGYTASFTVYAAAGGAATTTTVDKSATYIDWARKNLELNGFVGPQHQLVRSDIRSVCRESFAARPMGPGRRRPADVFQHQRHGRRSGTCSATTRSCCSGWRAHIAPGGIVFFSTNFRRFKLDEAALGDYTIRDITRQTIPEDFRNQRIHKCWKLVRRET